MPPKTSMKRATARRGQPASTAEPQSQMSSDSETEHSSSNQAAKRRRRHSEERHLLGLGDYLLSIIFKNLNVIDLREVQLLCRSMRDALVRNLKYVPAFKLAHQLSVAPCLAYAIEPCLPEGWYDDEGCVAFLSSGDVIQHVWLSFDRTHENLYGATGDEQCVLFRASLPTTSSGQAVCRRVPEAADFLFLPLRHRSGRAEFCFQSLHPGDRPDEHPSCLFLRLTTDQATRNHHTFLTPMCDLEDNFLAQMKLRGHNDQYLVICGIVPSFNPHCWNNVLAFDTTSGRVAAVLMCKATSIDEIDIDIAVALNAQTLAVAYARPVRGLFVLHTIDLITKQRVRRSFTSPVKLSNIMHQDLYVSSTELRLILLTRNGTLLLFRLPCTVPVGRKETAQCLTRISKVVGIPVLTDSLLAVFVGNGVGLLDVLTGRRVGFRAMPKTVAWGDGDEDFQPWHFHAESAAVLAKHKLGYFVFRFDSPAWNEEALRPEFSLPSEDLVYSRLRELISPSSSLSRITRSSSEAAKYEASYLSQAQLFQRICTEKLTPAELLTEGEEEDPFPDSDSEPDGTFEVALDSPNFSVLTDPRQ